MAAAAIAYLGILGAAGLLVWRTIHAFSDDAQKASAIAAAEIRVHVAAAASALSDEKATVPDAAKGTWASDRSLEAADASARAGDGAVAALKPEAAPPIPQQAAAPEPDTGATRLAAEATKAGPAPQIPSATTPPAPSASTSNLAGPGLAAPAITATGGADEAAAGFVSAGDKRLQEGDVATARLYYAKAVELGDGAGALRLGNSFDPGFLVVAGVRGMTGDRAEAERWYRRAVALGDPTAARALAALGGE